MKIPVEPTSHLLQAFGIMSVVTSNNPATTQMTLYSHLIQLYTVYFKSSLIGMSFCIVCQPKRSHEAGGCFKQRQNRRNMQGSLVKVVGKSCAALYSNSSSEKKDFIVQHLRDRVKRISPQTIYCQ